MARVDGTTSVSNNNFNSDNGTGLAVRTKLNQVLTALRTINAGTTDPVGVANLVQFQPHINNNVLKICTGVTGTGASATGSFTTIGNITEDNLGLLPVDGSNPMTGVFQLTAGSQTSPALNFGDTSTGFYRTGFNTIGITTNGDKKVTIQPTSTEFFGTATEGGIIRLRESNNNNASQYVQLKAPSSLSSNVNLVLPDSTGTNGQALVTDGSGVLSFATVASSGGGVVKNIVQTVYSQSAALSCNNIVSGQSFIDVTGMSLNITPQDAGNKILVEFDLNLMITNTSIFYINLVRIIGSNSEVLGLPNSPSGSGNANKRATQIISTQSSGSTHFRTPCSFKFLDTPNTTDQITYKLTIGTNNTNSSYRVAYLNREYVEDASFSSSQIMATEYDI